MRCGCSDAFLNTAEPWDLCTGVHSGFGVRETQRFTKFSQDKDEKTELRELSCCSMLFSYEASGGSGKAVSEPMSSSSSSEKLERLLSRGWVMGAMGFRGFKVKLCDFRRVVLFRMLLVFLTATLWLSCFKILGGVHARFESHDIVEIVGQTVVYPTLQNISKTLAETCKEQGSL